MAINANWEPYTPGKCYECRIGEHDDYDDDVKLCKVTGERGYKTRVKLCRHHRHSSSFVDVQEVQK